MTIETAEFGRSGHVSTRVIFGAAALAEVPQRVADETFDVLLEYGVNHIDVAAGYGEAEVRLKPLWHASRAGSSWPRRPGSAGRRRARRVASLAGAAGGRPRRPVQLHNLADPIEWDTALSPGGALEAAIEARERGLVGLSASPATARRSRPLTAAASNGSTSTRCCCPTTT